jgi:hypothetical protein
MQALAVRSTGIVARREGPSPLKEHNLLPAVRTKLEAVAVPAVSLASTERRPPVTAGPEFHVGPEGPTRAVAIAAYRRHMIIPAPKALFIDTYL